MERRILVINLNKVSTDSVKELGSLFEYASLEGVTDFVIFSNDILNKKFSVKDELKKLSDIIPSFINTIFFLGYKDGFRVSSKDVEALSYDSFSFILENHIT